MTSLILLYVVVPVLAGEFIRRLMLTFERSE